MINTNITSKSDSIQAVYDNYAASRYVVNRKYQRKLVWTQEEKKSFIDSILNHYSVPLFLLAQKDPVGNQQFAYEIIDGMQRLNAVTSFIENDFSVKYDGKECFFDLDTLARTLAAKNSNQIKQKYPTLPKEVCQNMVSYQLPFSYIIAEEQIIEEIFRRINSYGKQLSNQEIRQAGAIGKFSDLVRVISSYIRGDVSEGDNLSLNDMTKISLSNSSLEYGIDIEKVWWVQQHIITPPNMRVSRDEELIAWILSYILLGKNVEPSSKALNRLYRYDSSTQENSAIEIEQQIQKIGTQQILNKFCLVFSNLLNIIHSSGKNFCGLIFEGRDPEGLVRSFQIVYLALYELLIHDNLIIEDMAGIIEALSHAHGTCLHNILKANWDSKSRYNRIQALKGVLKPYFKVGNRNDVAVDNWTLQVDNIMRKSTLEGSQYDFKVGFHNFKDGVFNSNLVKKCIKTLTAAVNKEPNTVGYVIVGICETQESFAEFQRVYNTKKGTRYSNTNFYVTGIDEEVNTYYAGKYDNFQNAIIDIIKKEPIDEEFRQYLCTHLWFPKYYDVTLLVMQLESKNEPISYDDKYYEREGNSVALIDGAKSIMALMNRFGH